MTDSFDEDLSSYAQREMREAMGLQHWPWVTRLVNSVVLEAQRLHLESLPPAVVEDLTLVWDSNRSGEKAVATYFKAPHPLAKWHVWSRSGDTVPSYAMVAICGAGIGVTRDAPTLEVMRADEVPSKLCAKCAKVLARAT